MSSATYPSEMKFDQSTNSSSSLGMDQTLVSSTEVLRDIPQYIMAVKNQTGTWNITTSSTDSRVFYGLAGGLAGIGQNLLEYANSTSTLISETSKNLATSLAIEIGNYLQQVALSNGSGMFWPVFAGSPLIDFSYDFGLAGIASYFADLYNQTGVVSFATTAYQTIEGIVNGVNMQNGLHWNSSLVSILPDLNWYPNEELVYYGHEQYQNNYNEIVFTGQSLGSLGVAKAAFDVIEKLTITDFSNTTYTALNSSIYYVNSVSTNPGGERSFPVSLPSIGIKSTSVALGVSGAIDLYLDLSQYFGNTTYFDYADAMFNWLTGTVGSFHRYDYSTEINGSLSTKIHLGLSHGIAGNLQTIWKYSNMPTTTVDQSMITDLVFTLHNFGEASSQYYQYPEDQNNGFKINVGSLSYAYGGGGIFPLISQLAQEYGLSSLNQDLDKAKAYVYSRITTALNQSVLKDLNTGIPELIPNQGIPSSFHMLLIPNSGQLNVLTSSLDFGLIRVGQSFSQAVKIQNVGDEPITVSWSGISSNPNFITANTSKILGARETFNIFISFQATEEGDYSTSLTITTTPDIIYSVSLVASAYTNPSLEVVNAPANNSMITSREPVQFEVNATDVSSISDVTISIIDHNESMTTTAGSNLYSATWDLNSIANGTYVIRITATDTFGHNTQIKLIYTVGIYETPLVNRFFSNTTLYVILGLLGVVTVGALVITRRYMN